MLRRVGEEDHGRKSVKENGCGMAVRTRNMVIDNGAVKMGGDFMRSDAGPAGDGEPLGFEGELQRPA